MKVTEIGLLRNLFSNCLEKIPSAKRFLFDDVDKNQTQNQNQNQNQLINQNVNDDQVVPEVVRLYTPPIEEEEALVRAESIAKIPVPQSYQSCCSFDGKLIFFNFQTSG